MGFFDIATGGSLTWPAVGTRAGGTITGGYETRQATEYMTDKLKVDDRGQPVMMACVPLQTEDRDPAVPDDDGARIAYIDKPGQKIAIRDAIRAAGAADLEVGGKLYITFTGETPSTKGSPLKTWAAEYIPPVGSLGVQPAAGSTVTGLATDPAILNDVLQAKAAVQRAPVAAPAAPATNVDGLAKVKKLLGAGFDAATIHELVPEMSLDMIAAIANI